MKVFNDILQNGRGRIVGTVQTYRRPLNKREREICSQFIETVSRGRKEVETVSDNMKANVIALAGEAKKISVNGKRGFLLLDCGPESNRGKWVPCTIHDDEELSRKLSFFREGDYIKIKGHIRVWSQKVEGSKDDWKTNVEARIEEIKSDAPKREARTTKQTAFDDDGIPF